MNLELLDSTVDKLLSYKPSFIKKQIAIRSIGTLRYIDLFAGIGGIRIPFDELGYKNVFSSEIDDAACQTYKANFGE